MQMGRPQAQREGFGKGSVFFLAPLFLILVLISFNKCYHD